MAKALPILSSVKIRPSGAIAFAPPAKQRAANRMSAVITISSVVIFSTIQSSASSCPSGTTIISIFRLLLPIRNQLLLTIKTFNLWRLATLKTSSLTGQASAST